jgi:hypothetical protein
MQNRYFCRLAFALAVLTIEINKKVAGQHPESSDLAGGALMVMGIFFGGMFLVLTAMFHLAIGRRPARQKVLVSRRTLKRKNRAGA